MNHAQEPFMIAEVAIDATDQTILTLMRMVNRAHQAGRHKHFVCSVVGFDRGAADPWATPAFRSLCGRLVESGFVWFMDASTLHPPGQPEHLQAGLGALEIWMISQGVFGTSAPTPAMLEQAKRAIDKAGLVAAATLRAEV
jgi:hypothetical protein